jgi:hypothetical protein
MFRAIEMLDTIIILGNIHGGTISFPPTTLTFLSSRSLNLHNFTSFFARKRHFPDIKISLVCRVILLLLTTVIGVWGMKFAMTPTPIHPSQQPTTNPPPYSKAERAAHNTFHNPPCHYFFLRFFQ